MRIIASVVKFNLTPYIPP